jgi:hypothetical protein
MGSLKQLTSKFARLAVLPVERSLVVVHRELLGYAREQFRTQGRAGGQPWADYSGEPKYRAYKLALGASPQVLRWEPGKQERLYPSLTDPRDRNHVWRVGGKSVAFGSALPYVARIEQGGTGPFGERSPARRLLPMASAIRRRVNEAIAADLRSRMEQLGFVVEADRG